MNRSNWKSSVEVWNEVKFVCGNKGLNVSKREEDGNRRTVYGHPGIKRALKGHLEIYNEIEMME